jgi:tetratricopeptide (TPR) repeat protein
MIERLLAAEAALGRGELDAAVRLFDQVANADPRNAIALVGLARIAERRGDRSAAADLARRALAIDPEEAAAARLLIALESAPVPEAQWTPSPAGTPRSWWRRWLHRLRGRG